MPPVLVEWATGPGKMIQQELGAIAALFSHESVLSSVDEGELVIRDLGNLFLNHRWTRLWKQVCTFSYFSASCHEQTEQQASVLSVEGRRSGIPLPIRPSGPSVH